VTSELFYFISSQNIKKIKKKKTNKTNDVKESLITLLPIPLKKSLQNKFNNIKQDHNQ